MNRNTRTVGSDRHGMVRLALSVVVGAALAFTMACTSATDTSAVELSSDRPGRAVPVAGSPLQPTAFPSGVVMTEAPKYLAGSQHAAFPGMARMVDGRQRLVWRQGSDHWEDRDGRILATTLDQWGQNPSPAETLLAGDTDYRDPSISYIDGREYLTFFTGSAANSAEGAYVSIDGGPPVRIDGGMPYAAISAPIVKLPDGRLGTAFYGRLPGEAKDSAWMAWSSDGGLSWTQNRILNPAVESTAEPYLVVDGNLVHLISRWGNSLAIRTSWDSGKPGSWGNPGIARNQATGRPTTISTSSGMLVMVYRSLPTKAAQLAYSPDHGVSWYDSTQVMSAPAGSLNGMTYATLSEIGPGYIRAVIGMEQPVGGAEDGRSALYGTYLAVSVR